MFIFHSCSLKILKLYAAEQLTSYASSCAFLSQFFIFFIFFHFVHSLNTKLLKLINQYLSCLAVCSTAAFISSSVQYPERLYVQNKQPLQYMISKLECSTTLLNAVNFRIDRNLIHTSAFRMPNNFQNLQIII